MAESGEAGVGRMAEPLEIVAAVEALLARGRGDEPLAGQARLVTSGPTHEPIDPVRYIANRSSGKQGHAIAAAPAAAGAEVTLVSGPVTLPDPPGVTIVRSRPRARCWRRSRRRCRPTSRSSPPRSPTGARRDAGAQKIKKDGGGPPRLALVENPDILATRRASQDASGRSW